MQAEIERKVAGHEVSVSAAPEQPAQIIDLMEALKASLAARGQPAALGKREMGERKPPRSAAPHSARTKERASRG
jgi:non-homologous end joining protein Ku